MTTRHRSLAALAATASLALVLTGCAGSTDVTGTGDQSLEEQGITEGEPTSSAVCAPDTPDCEDTTVLDPADDVAAADCESDAPDCQDTVDPAAGSCLAGDADCTDESYDGQDVTRPVLLADASSGATTIEAGTSSGATGQIISNAYAVDDMTLELTFDGRSCDVLEDVLVTESDTEVRLLVLAGQSADAEMCTAEVVQWTTTVALSAPLGDRLLLDLAG